MFNGLSAFPLTPVSDAGVDASGFAHIVERLAHARVDSICALGSTGSYAYLSRPERARVAQLAVQHAGDVPVFVGVGALRTRDVLEHVADAQQAGAAAVLLAPMSYQPLTDDEVFGLFATVSAELSVPLIVYDNPATTRFRFSDALHARIAELPGVGSLKLPPMQGTLAEARSRVSELRALTPPGLSIGASGDGFAARALLAGCNTWYSVLAGVLPAECLEITRAATSGDVALTLALSDRFAPLWSLFAEHGSLRVAAAVAEDLGVVAAGTLPLPVRGLDTAGRAAVHAALAHAELDLSHR